MKNSIFTVLAALVLYPAGAQPVTPQDRRRAAELVERMTLDEKIGQLVQQRGGGAVTGPDKTELSVERLVREGRCGSVFNIKSFEETERLQRIAVEESRLGIPLLIGAACVSVVLEVLTNIVVASPETGLFNQFQLGDGGLAGLISWPGLILAAVLLALTNWVKPTKNLHPIVFIAASAVVGVVFRFAGV